MLVLHEIQIILYTSPLLLQQELIFRNNGFLVGMMSKLLQHGHFSESEVTGSYQKAAYGGELGSMLDPNSHDPVVVRRQR